MFNRKRAIAACMGMFIIMFMFSAFAENETENEDMVYFLLTRDEFRHTNYDVKNGLITAEECNEIQTEAKAYIQDNYDVAFKYKAKRGGNITFLLFGFKSGLVLEFNKRYSNLRYGMVISGALESGWIVQYENLNHTVFYKYVESNGHLDIIDNKTDNEFFTDYTISSVDDAISVFYPMN